MGSFKTSSGVTYGLCFQARVARIQQIEKDILRLGARLQVTDAGDNYIYTSH